MLLKEFIKNIFSVRNANDRNHKILTIFGIKIKIRVKNISSKNLNVDSKFNFYLNRYIWNYADDKTLEDLKYMAATKYCWKNYDNRLWLVYLAMLIENEKDSCDIESVARKYLYFFGLKDIEKFFAVSYWFYENNFANESIEKSAKIYQKILASRDEKAFLSHIKGKTIAVVGNGPSEIGKNKGKEIDNHDIVIRFNEFYTQGYEKDYGIKCDIWANFFGNTDFLSYENRPECLYMWTNDKYYFYNDIAQKNAYSCIDKPWIVISDMRRYAWDLLSLGYDPTSGFVVIMYLYKLLGSFDNVDFYGFKFLEKEECDSKHYFKTKFINLYKGHDFDSEAVFLKNLIYTSKNKHTNKK